MPGDPRSVIVAVTRRFWRFVHNVIAHPLMEVLPERVGTWFHDETARRAWEDSEPTGSP